MYSLQALKQLNEQAAKDSRKRGDVPFIPQLKAEFKIPSIGERCPRGWKRVNIKEAGLPMQGVYEDDNLGYGAYFVDSSGFGSPREPALTVDAFMKLVNDSGKYGYAIVEAGQFQVKIGVFTHR